MKIPIVTCGIFLYSTPAKKILICHPTNASWKSWSIPKGLKDPGEESFDSAIRELYEECGIDAGALEVVSSHSLPPIKYAKQNKILEAFLLIVKNDFSGHTFICHSLVKDQFPEIDKWAWITPDQIPEKLHESQQQHYETIMEVIKDL
jgi:8-oxo-dGTP pyrophosphatase MutT (NUDIX family)